MRVNAPARITPAIVAAPGLKPEEYERAVALIGGLTLWILLCGLIPPVALLVGAAGALDLAIGLLGRSIAALLEKIDQAPSP